MRKISAIALDITTACNLHCPECCCRVHERPAVHYPYSYFTDLASWIYGIDRVDLTGGEPTCHPQFPLYVPRFKALFGCKQLTLETNGFQCQKYANVLHHFDAIRLSRYEDNRAECDWVLENFPCGGRTYVQNGSTCVEIGVEPDERKHISRERRGAGGRCMLGTFEFALFTEGKFWPCRLGPAVKGARGIEPCVGWERKILEMEVPCQECWFSPGGENVQPVR